jgi:RecA/RadA recombinase
LARRKKKKSSVDLKELNITEGIDTNELLKSITSQLDSYLSEKYGDNFDPDTLLIKTDIKPLDAILGGGLILGMPVMVSGPGEAGKTTIAWQLVKKLQEQYPLSLAVYIDIEGSANISNPNLGIKSRIDLMNINKDGVIYHSMTMHLEDTIQFIIDTVEYKRQIEEKINKQIPMIIIWDSIADTDPKKLIEDADNPNSVIGLKARTVQFYLGKIKPLLRRNQVMLYLIDQVRANITDNMNNPYAGKVEKSVGEINNLKSATGAKSVEHKLRQWLFLLKGPEVYDYPGVLGWYLDIYVVKSKLAPSGFSVRTVFDKRYGIDKFWTEYYFISHLQPFEEKIFKKLGGQQSSRAKQFKSDIEEIQGLQMINQKIVRC